MSDPILLLTECHECLTPFYLANSIVYLCNYKNNLILRVNVTTIIIMKLTFDPKKDAANLAKHLVSLAEAANLDWENALIWTDCRRDYGEDRQVALVPMNQRLYFVAFVDRKTARRIISLRRANRREFDHYEQETN
ncbi:MAG: BrnT family toxin [Methylotenera sp.]